MKKEQFDKLKDASFDEAQSFGISEYVDSRLNDFVATDIKHAITEAKNQTIIWVVAFQLGFAALAVSIVKFL